MLIEQVDTYEVLVPALQPLRYVISDTVHMPRIPRILGDSTSDRSFERLKYVIPFRALFLFQPSLPS